MSQEIKIPATWGMGDGGLNPGLRNRVRKRVLAEETRPRPKLGSDPLPPSKPRPGLGSLTHDEVS